MKGYYKYFLISSFILILSCGQPKYRVAGSSLPSAAENKLIFDPTVTITANYYFDYFQNRGVNCLVLDYMIVIDSNFRNKFFEVEYIVVTPKPDILLRIYSIGPIDTTIKIGSLINFKKVNRKKPGFVFYRKLNKVLNRQSPLQRYWTYSTFAVVEKVIN